MTGWSLEGLSGSAGGGERYSRVEAGARWSGTGSASLTGS